MADDTKGKTPSVDSKATEAATDSIKKFAAAERDFTNAIRPNLQALDQWDLGLEKVASEQEKLTDVIKEQLLAIKQHAREVGSLQSQFRDLGGAVTGYLGTLKSMISITSVYEKLIHKVQVGQKAYMGSLQASTASVGRASAESTRQIDAYKAAMNSANKTAIAYNLNMEEMKQQFEGLHTRLVSVTSAYENQSEIFDKVSRSAVQFSRFMGVDFAEAQDIITDRLENSTKSLNEIRVEMMAVAKEADKYTQNLQKMGNEALKAGTVTRQGFLKVLKEIDQMFKGGMYTAAEGFAKTTSSILLKAKEMGFTPAEAQTMAGSFGKVFSDMARFDNIFGARVAQRLGEVIKDVGNIQDENLRKRMEPYVARAKAGTLNVVDLKGIADAARGSSEGMRLLLKTFRESGMAPDVMRSVLGEAMGPGQQHIADALAKLLQEGKMEEAFELIGASDKKQAEEKEKELDIWTSSFEEFNKQAHASTKIEYQIAMKTKEIADRIKAFFEKYPLMMMGIMAGAQLGGSLLGGLLARGGGAAAAGGMATLGGAGGAGGAAAGGAAAGGIGLGGVLALGAAGYGGYQAGKLLDKAFYKRAAEGGHISDTTKRRLGPNAGVGDLLGDWAARKTPGLAGWMSNVGWALTGGKGKSGKGYSEEGMEMLKNVTRIRGVLTDAHLKEYQQNEKQIEWARKNWDKLDDGQRQAYSQRMEQQKELKHFIEVNTTSEAQKKKDREALVVDYSKRIIKNLGEESKLIKKGDEGSLRDAVKYAVASSGADSKDTAAVMTEIMKSPVYASMIKQFDAKKVQDILKEEIFMRSHYADYGAEFQKPQEKRSRWAAEAMEKMLREGGIPGVSAATGRIGQELVERNLQTQAAKVGIEFKPPESSEESVIKMTPGADGKVTAEMTNKQKMVFDFLSFPQWAEGQTLRNKPRNSNR